MLEEEVKVEDRWRLFRPCRWINLLFTRIRVSAERTVAVAAAEFEAEDGQLPVGAVVGGEVSSGRIRRHFHISLVWRPGGDAVICFLIST